MDPVAVDTYDSVDLDEPILIEGLPGVGLVGKLAVDHLVEEMENTTIRRMYSEHLPPGVGIDEDGIASLPSISVHAIEHDEQDLLVLTGESQAQTPVGQYRVAGAVIDMAEELGVEDIVTIGGFGTGQQIDEYTVVGALAQQDEDFKHALSDAGVEFEGDRAPENIVGMSGLLLGLGTRAGMRGTGLLGITPGYYVDPGSARAVLDVLQDVFDFTIPLETLDEQAEQVQEFLEQLQELQQQQDPTSQQTSEDLRYFG